MALEFSGREEWSMSAVAVRCPKCGQWALETVYEFGGQNEISCPNLRCVNYKFSVMR